MIFKTRYTITIFVSLCSLLIVILSELDCLYIFSSGPINDISLTTIELVEDIRDFSLHFQRRFASLKDFINENQQKADNLGISYYLFTYINPKIPYKLEPTEESWIQSNLDPTHPTIFLIHGYASKINLENSTFAMIKDSILSQSVYRNVFIMDYSSYSTGLFSETTKMSFLVSQNLANLIHFLMQNATLKADQFHLVGAGLGGQVAANAAALVPGLGRVTGLDPAGPIFDLFPPNFRISSDDARFVDIIHTSFIAPFPKGMGISYPVGDIDFFPNGGQYQPGCKTSDKNSRNKNKKNSLSIARCNHDRAVSLFLESICLSDCQFLGVKCKNYDDFKKGRCNPANSDTVKMGYYAQDREVLPSFQTKENIHKGTFYLTTSSKFPFCVNYTEIKKKSDSYAFQRDYSTTYLIIISFVIVMLNK